MEQKEFKKHIIPMQSAMQLLAERMLGDVCDAEDVVQDVFVTLWERREELDKVVRIESYCMQMVRMRCIDLIRKRKRQMEHVETIRNLSDEEVMMEVEEMQDRSALLDKLMMELPEKQRKAVRMRYIDECDTRQIEKALQMSSSNVYTTLSRAVQTLKDKLNNLKI